MTYFQVKNKRLKMSPGGIITLPVSGRKALGMEQGTGSRIGISVEDNCVVLSAKPEKKEKHWPISKQGQMQLKGKAKELLDNGKNRHYWLELDDKNRLARLVPF